MRRLTAHIKPNARTQPRVEPQDDGSLLVYVRQPAVDGRANKALLQLLAKFLDTPKTSLQIVRGATAKTKLVELSE